MFDVCHPEQPAEVLGHDVQLIGESYGTVLSGGAVLVDHRTAAPAPKDQIWVKQHIVKKGEAHTFKLFDAPLCEELVAACEEFAAGHGGWPSSRHQRHPTMDIPVSLLGLMGKDLFTRVRETILPVVGTLFDVEVLLSRHVFLACNAPSPCYRQVDRLSVADLFVVKYSTHGQRELAMHADGEATPLLHR